MTAADPVLTLLGRPAEPGLESTLTAWRLGAIPLSDVLATLSGWPVLVLTYADSSTLEPLMLQSASGTPLVAVFTSPDRVGAHARPGLRPMWVRGGILAAGVKGGAGIVVNPGSQPACEIPPADLAAVRDGSPEPASAAPGSRLLTALELAAVRLAAGTGTRADAVAAAADQRLIVASSTDPGRGDLELATSPEPGGTSLLAWTHEKLVRGLDPSTTWLVGAPSTDLQAMLPDAASIRVDPGTVFEVRFAHHELLR